MKQTLNMRKRMHEEENENKKFEFDSLENAVNAAYNLLDQVDDLIKIEESKNKIIKYKPLKLS